MTEAVIATPVKVVPFSMRRNSNEDRIKQDEEELKELEKQFEAEAEKKPEAKQEEEEEPTSAEEKTFKKRYGDLRRHSQQKEAEFQKQLDDLRSQLEAATRK